MRRDELELMAAIEGRELSKDEKRSIEKITTGKAARVSRNLSEAAAVAAFKVVDIAGRGIITKGTPTEHEFFRNYDQKKNELISLYAPQITGNEARSVFSLNLLKHAYRAHYEKLKKEGLPLPAGSPDQYDTLIDEKIGKIEKINNTALKEFNNHVNDLNQKALEESEGLTDAEDNMRKFRILQIFLMASPLGLFNFLGPITQALAPFMDGGTTFAQNMASLVTSDVFGPFGWLADTIELDVMIEGAFKLPGIEQAGELIKEGLGVLDNFSDLVGPTLGGGDPLLPLAIATVFSIRRFGGPELDYYNKYHAAKKSHGEKLQKAFENFVSGKSQYDPDKKGSGFTVHATDEERKVIKGALGEHIDEMAELSLIADLGEFISSQVKEGNAGNLAIFNGFKIKCDVDGTAGELSLSELAAKDVDFSRSSNVSDFLSALTEDNLKAMVKKMLVFESDEIGKRLDRFDAISNPELEAEGQKLFQSAQCAKIIDLAKDRGVTSSSPQGASLSDIAQNCKEKITAQEIEKWERMRNILRRPGKSPKDPEAKSMHNDLLASFQTGAKL
jgi:hypothetical protein